MIVKVKFHGILADWITPETVEFRMDTPAVFADLLKQIDERFADKMPKQLWDKKMGKFKSSILAMGHGRNLESLDAPLKREEEITFYLMLSGG